MRQWGRRSAPQSGIAERVPSRRSAGCYQCKLITHCITACPDDVTVTFVNVGASMRLAGHRFVANTTCYLLEEQAYLIAIVTKGVPLTGGENHRGARPRRPSPEPTLPPGLSGKRPVLMIWLQVIQGSSVRAPSRPVGEAPRSVTSEDEGSSGVGMRAIRAIGATAA